MSDEEFFESCCREAMERIRAACAELGTSAPVRWQIGVEQSEVFFAPGGRFGISEDGRWSGFVGVLAGEAAAEITDPEEARSFYRGFLAFTDKTFGVVWRKQCAAANLPAEVATAEVEKDVRQVLELEMRRAFGGKLMGEGKLSMWEGATASEATPYFKDWQHPTSLSASEFLARTEGVAT